MQLASSDRVCFRFPVSSLVSSQHGFEGLLCGLEMAAALILLEHLCLGLGLCFFFLTKGISRGSFFSIFASKIQMFEA